MPIPETRRELCDLLGTTYTKLTTELDDAGPEAAALRCVDDWTVKDLLAVRAWWTARVVEWIEAGQRGETPVTPAPGFRWSETPRLNAELVRAARRESLPDIRARLDAGFRRAQETIEALDDTELLDAGVFGWAGKWPLSRWLSINTARQYATARTLIRRAVRGSRR